MNYSKKLNKCREEYPFNFWLQSYEEGIGPYSIEHCLQAESIFDGLIESLINIGEHAEEPHKVELFEAAVKRLNLTREAAPELIETMEREEFCDLFDLIAISAGLNPRNYGSGEGIASEWRAW